MRPEIKRMHAERRRRQLIIVGMAAVVTALVFLLIEVFSA